MSRNRVSGVLLASVLFPAVLPGVARAQHDHVAETRAPRPKWGAQAVGLLSRVSPAHAGRDLTEAYITQPVLMAQGALAGEALTWRGVANLEGLTLRRGELNAGVWGEGYVDRRHPHTYLHEALVAAQTTRHGLAASLTAGRGFAPFGTDDPMVRPFVKYPANHHLSQILERWIAIAALRAGPLALEAGTFNGDEPSGPTRLGRIERFGDSWASRATLQPYQSLELQASMASVTSPEVPLGDGLDHHKLSASARMAQRARGVSWYVLAEYARTDFRHRGTAAFSFSSYLGEISAQRAAWGVAARCEVTTRPEEERLLDPFRVGSGDSCARQYLLV